MRASGCMVLAYAWRGDSNWERTAEGGDVHIQLYEQISGRNHGGCTLPSLYIVKGRATTHALLSLDTPNALSMDTPNAHCTLSLHIVKARATTLSLLAHATLPCVRIGDMYGRRATP